MKPRRKLTAASIGAIAISIILCSEQFVFAEPPSKSESPQLVRRNQVRLELAGAQLAVNAALHKAREMELKVNIAVVDDGGHLIAFARMDGARPSSVATSMTKAISAATQRGETGPLLDHQTKSINTHLSLAVERAAEVSGGKFTTLKGGIPILVDEQVIGAVGVGGATGEQDAEIARAGVESLVRAIHQSQDTPE